MPDRFYLETPPAGDQVDFPEAEVQHLAKVMRVQPGDMVGAFDGSGVEYQVRIASVGKKQVRGEIVARAEVSREAAVPLTLAVALPKGERQRWLVEKCVELGVTRLIPLVTERGVAQPVTKAVERLRRTVIEASKQCGRNRLMEVDEGRALAEVLESTPAETRRLVLHPGEAPLAEVLGYDPPGSGPAPVLALIGPEGGFTDAEVQQATQTGCRAVSLGPRILRVETAALAIAALITLKP